MRYGQGCVPVHILRGYVASWVNHRLRGSCISRLGLTSFHIRILIVKDFAIALVYVNCCKAWEKEEMWAPSYMIMSYNVKKDYELNFISN